MDLRLNLPPQPREAALPERIASAMRTLESRGDLADLLGYGSSVGSLRDRTAGVRWIEPLLGTVSPDDVLVCAGGASLLVALVTGIASPGASIVTEALTYPGIRAVCRHFGFPLFGVATDGKGMVPAALAEVCERVRPAILYCTPTIQNPTTATMCATRRSEIAAVAQRFELTILEDDAYGALRDPLVPPIASIAPERTYYMATLSKAVSPGLRIAYCVAPKDGRARLTEALRVVTLSASGPTAAIASQWIEDGSAWAIRDAVRSECAARQSLAREILDDERIEADPHGPHLWMPVSSEWDIPELGVYLRANGVAAKGDGFAVDGAHPNALRIALGAARDRNELAQSLHFLSKALRNGPQHLRQQQAA